MKRVYDIVDIYGIRPWVGGQPVDLKLEVELVENGVITRLFDLEGNEISKGGLDKSLLVGYAKAGLAGLNLPGTIAKTLKQQSAE